MRAAAAARPPTRYRGHRRRPRRARAARRASWASAERGALPRLRERGRKAASAADAPGRTCFRRPKEGGASPSSRRPRAARRRWPRTVRGSAIRCAHGETGFLVPHGDVDALAARMLELAGDPALVARLGAAARRFAEALTWDARGRRDRGASRRTSSTGSSRALNQEDHHADDHHRPPLRDLRRAAGARQRRRRAGWAAWPTRPIERHRGLRRRRHQLARPSSGCTSPAARCSSATGEAKITARRSTGRRRNSAASSTRRAGARRAPGASRPAEAV